MSVDFKGCDKCERGVYDEYVGTCGGEYGLRGCGKSLCTECLINNDIGSSYAYKYGTRFDGTPEQLEEYEIGEDDYCLEELIEDSGIDPKYCPYCSGKEVHDLDVLSFLLKRYELDLEEIREEIRNNKG